MLDDYCIWAENNPTSAWLVFIGFMVTAAVGFAYVCWPTKIPGHDEHETNSVG